MLSSARCLQVMLITKHFFKSSTVQHFPMETTSALEIKDRFQRVAIRDRTEISIPFRFRSILRLEAEFRSVFRLVQFRVRFR